MQIALIRTLLRPTGEVKQLLVHLQDQYLPTRCDSLEAAARYADGYQGVWASALDVARFYSRPESWTHCSPYTTGLHVSYQKQDGSIGELEVKRP